MTIPDEARKVLERRVDQLWARAAELSERRDELVAALDEVDEEMAANRKERVAIVGFLHETKTKLVA